MAATEISYRILRRGQVEWGRWLLDTRSHKRTGKDSVETGLSFIFHYLFLPPFLSLAYLYILFLLKYYIYTALYGLLDSHILLIISKGRFSNFKCNIISTTVVSVIPILKTLQVLLQESYSGGWWDVLGGAFSTIGERKKFLLATSERKGKFLLLWARCLSQTFKTWGLLLLNTTLLPCNFYPLLLVIFWIMHSLFQVTVLYINLKTAVTFPLSLLLFMLNISTSPGHSSNDTLSRSLTHTVALPCSLEMLYQQMNSVFHLCSNPTEYNGNST